ncbi:hypothetical protein V8D89_001318, partial [Ganoderma adspersum]
MHNVDMKPYMPPLPLHIPTEVCENVVDMLFSWSTKDTLTNIATLHSCALVCQDWRVRSQKSLFYLVQLSDNVSLHRLSIILDNGPHLRDYVYQIELTGYHLHNTTSIFTLFPAVFAGKLPNLRRIDVVHYSETVETRFPKTMVSPKAKSIPFIPLHRHFSAVLRSFTTVSELYLIRTTFRSFSELLQTIRALTNLEDLVCMSVHWITTGGSHPGADFMQQPDRAAGRYILPPFMPKLRTLRLDNIALYRAKRLILTNGPHLNLNVLSLTIPLSIGPEERADGGGNDLSSCTALEELVLWLMPQFSVDTHGEFVTALLASWKPRSLEPSLVLQASLEMEFTCRAFADVLRSIGAITEAWLQTVEQAHPEDGSVNATCMKYKLVVQLCDWETEKERWEDHLKSCFPTWLQLGQLNLTFCAAQYKHREWAKEKISPKSDTSIPASRAEKINSSVPIKV